MKCPTCPDSILVMADRSGVEIDYCPQCRGIWLDRGELDKLLERAATEFAAASPPAAAPAPVAAASSPPPAPRYDEPRYQDPRYDDRKYDDRYDPRYAKKRKKKSFLDDILDF